MACPASYTVVIIPLKTSLHSLDALRFYLWIKRLKDIEIEKDSLWAGLEVLNQARQWYHRRLEVNKAQQICFETNAGSRAEAAPCLLRSCVQRVNGSLGSLMSEPNVSGSSQFLLDTVADSSLRWQNTELMKEVGEKNKQISMLEMERDHLLQELGELETHL